MMPPVALLVPCHNAARFVPRFLAMVSAQRAPYAEVLFYDDGSTDDTFTLLRSAGAKVLAGGSNRGAAHARNQLLAASRSPFVHFHDVDDALDPGFVEELQPLLAPDTAACCAYDRRRPDGTLTEVNRFSDLASARQRVRYFIDHFLTFNAAVYPRAAIEAACGFPEDLRLSEDLTLLLRLAASSLRFAYHDRVLTTWLLRPDSTHHAADELRRARATRDCFLRLGTELKGDTARELAVPILDLAWRLHLLGAHQEAIAAAETAGRLGARVIRNRGRRLLLHSLLLGPSRTYEWLAARKPASCP